MRASSAPGFLATAKRAYSRSPQKNTVKIVNTAVTTMTAVPDACPETMFGDDKPDPRSVLSWLRDSLHDAIQY